MEEQWLKQWNNRFSKEDYAYGELPNEFLKEQLKKFIPGEILFGAEGEGRNSVYAARFGWNVCAFDISIEGKKKALRLAEKNNVVIDYRIGALPELGFKNEQFDVVALIYAHFPPNIRAEYHHLLNSYLREGGHILFEAFGKNHLEYRRRNEKVGGPSDYNMLFSKEELTTAFNNFDIIKLEEKVVELNEGTYHVGLGSVIRFVGKKTRPPSVQK